MKIKYTLKEVKPRIFYVEFEDRYQCNMTFLRYAEFYESPSPKFRNKQFDIVDFMEWYVKQYKKDTFTYPTDWSGFNIPGRVIEEIQKAGILDYNRYDAEMEKIYTRCIKKYDDDFYLIAALKGKKNKKTLNHEIAHGLFYTVPEYKKEMTQLVKELNPKLKKQMYKWLKEIGYTTHVYIDECQAYLATGHYFDAQGADKTFIKVFKKYSK